MPATTVDSITTIHQAILTLLKNSATFTSLVKLGNLPDFTSPNFVRIQEAIQAGGLPECIVEESDWEFDPNGTNSMVYSFAHRWDVKVCVDSLIVTKLNCIKNAIAAALTKGTDCLGINTQLTGISITGWRIMGGRDKRGADEESRGTERWTTAASIHVEWDLSSTVLDGIN